MPINLKPQVKPVLFGTLPPSFAEQVGDKMCFHEEGDNILICKPWLDEAEEGFKQSELHQALQRVFSEFPDHDQLVLQPGLQA